MATSVKKNFVPDLNTAFPGGWEKSIDSAGTIIREASHDAVQARLTLAEGLGTGPTAVLPWYFMVHDILYIAKGNKNAAGRWVLACANEIEAYERTYTLGVKIALTSGQYSGMMSFALPTRPYRRLVEVHATAFGSTTGNVDLAAKMGGDAYKLARFDTYGNGDGSSVAVSDIRAVEPDQAVTVAVGVRGGSGGGTVQLSAQAYFNEAFVKCYPIDMA